MDILINVIFNKASNTMDEKIRIVSIIFTTILSVPTVC